MLADVTLEQACAAFKATGGPIGATYPKHVQAALRHFGYELGLPQRVAARYESDPRGLPGLQLVKMGGKARFGHWVVVDRGQIFDPAGMWPFVGGLRLITSYEVTG
jgi:hypothetical protein